MTGTGTLIRFGRRLVVAAMLAVCSSLLLLATSPVASAQSTAEEEIALSLATVLRAARTVVSEGQARINDPNIGDKRFSSDYVLEETRFNYEIETGTSLDSISPGSLHHRLIEAELRAITEVVDQWQDVINMPGIGYKGFLPAIFAGEVARRFSAIAQGAAEIKLTAPVDYVRNQANLPDDWEHTVIEDELRSSDHAYGRPIYRRRAKDGRPSHRLILPEYYSQSCLSCHGGTAGDIDLTGGQKEGGSLGELGGAISVTIYADR